MGFFGGSKLVGIDIGASSIKLVMGTRKKKTFSVERFSVVPLPARSIDERGIISTDAVAAAISAALQEVGQKNPECSTLIHGSGVISKRIVLDGNTKEKEIADAVKWEAEQVFPQDIASVLVEHIIIGKDAQVPGMPTGSKGWDIMLVGVREEEAGVLMDLIEAFPAKLKSMDMEAFALSDFLEGMVDMGPDGIVGLIDVGAAATRVCVRAAGKVVFVREFPVAGNSFTDAIAAALGLSFENAESIKVQEETGIPQEAVEALQGLLVTWKSELQQCEDIFVTQYSQGPIPRWYIFGGGARTPGLFDVLRDERFGDRVLPLPAPDIFVSGNKAIPQDQLSLWSYRLLSAAAASCRKG